MRDGICPKCGSHEVYTSLSPGQRSFIIVSFWTVRGERLRDYVCADCGYAEQYVLSPNSLEKIRQKWERADSLPNEKRKR